MKCRLCGQPTAGQDKLCGNCGKALKRVREGTAAMRALGIESARAEVAGNATVAPSAPPPLQNRRAVRRRYAVVGTVGVVVIGLAILGQQVQERRRSQSAADNDLLPRTAAPSSGEAGMPTATVAPGESTAAAISAESLAAPGPNPESAVATDPARAPPPPVPPRAAGRTKVDARRASASTKVASVQGTSAARQKGAGDSPPAAPTESPSSASDARTDIARAPVAAAGDTPDAAQRLAGALEKCNGEKLLAGFICEQKVRLSFCEGKWGQIPQCATAKHSD